MLKKSSANLFLITSCLYLLLAILTWNDRIVMMSSPYPNQGFSWYNFPRLPIGWIFFISYFIIWGLYSRKHSSTSNKKIQFHFLISLIMFLLLLLSRTIPILDSIGFHLLGEINPTATIIELWIRQPNFYFLIIILSVDLYLLFRSKKTTTP